MADILSKLHPPKGAVKADRRIGRGHGSGKGKTSGKGMKGQRARSGGRGKPHFEGGQMPLQRRLPIRGFNHPFPKHIAVVNLRDLLRFDAGTEITPGLLQESGLVKKMGDGIKVLGVGELDRAITVYAHAFSGTAKEKIEKAGGKAVLILDAAAKAAATAAEGASQ
jgi:large subunit ribosomal protein L15